MKKHILYLLIAALLLSFTGCGNSDGETKDPNAGVYTAVKANMSGFDVEVTDLFGTGFSIELKDNGKCYITVDGTGENGTWALGDKDVFTIKGGGMECSGTLKNGEIILENVLNSQTTLTLRRETKTDANDKKAGPAGYYTLYSMAQGDEGIDQAQILSLGLNSLYIQLNENGSGTTNIDDANEEITWVNGKIITSDGTFSFAVTDDKLELTLAEGVSYTFIRTAGGPTVIEEKPLVLPDTAGTLDEATGGLNRIEVPVITPPPEPTPPPIGTIAEAKADGYWYGVVFYEYYDGEDLIEIKMEDVWGSFLSCYGDYLEIYPNADMVFDPYGTELFSSMIWRDGSYFESNYMDEYGSWIADPYESSSGFPEDWEINNELGRENEFADDTSFNELVLFFSFISPTDENEYCDITFYLRPWGDRWEDTGLSFVPYTFDDYLSKIDAQQAAPELTGPGSSTNALMSETWAWLENIDYEMSGIEVTYAEVVEQLGGVEGVENPDGAYWGSVAYIWKDKYGTKLEISFQETTSGELAYSWGYLQGARLP